MQNITLISTAHWKKGLCTSDALLEIIEQIGPDVIFEERPHDFQERLYNENPVKDEPLEVKCIKKYLLNHDIKNIGVDIHPSPTISSQEINFMFDSFKQYAVYRKLDDEQNFLTGQEGFSYLNSYKCSELFEQMKTTEKYLLEVISNKNILQRIYKLFHEEHDNRENEMLQNIYNYSNENQYEQAVFFLGAAHRNSVLQKVGKFQAKENLKLNWTFYNTNGQT